MSWPHYSSMPSEDELAGTIDEFLGLRPEFDGFIKPGKTIFDKQTKQPGNRYGPFDRYEQLSSLNVLCECENENLALEIEKLAQNIVRQKGILIPFSDALAGSRIGDNGKNFCVYITKYKPELYKCPMKTCSHISTYDGIMLHRKTHDFINYMIEATNYAERKGYKPPDVQILPIAWVFRPPSDSTQCLFCGKNLKSNALMKLHAENNCSENVENRKLVPCVICGKLCTERYLSPHALTHDKTRNVECEKCGKVVTKEWLQKHMRFLHADVLQEKCPDCNKMISLEWMRKHRKKHEAKKLLGNWKCNLCGLEMTTNFKANHIKAHEDKKMQCPHCKKFYNDTVIERHIRDVHILPKVKCSECDFEGTRAQLHGHKRSHEPPQICSYCQKGISRHHMERHLKSCPLAPSTSSKSTNPPTKKSKKEE